MPIKLSAIKEATTEALIKASTSFRPDQLIVYQHAIEKEADQNAKWLLELILENARVAEEKNLPLCDDTGVPHIQVEIGDEADLDVNIGAVIDNIKIGIKEGLRSLPGRPMAVRGNDLGRIAQTEGLFDDPAKLAPAPIMIKTVNSKQLRLTVLMLGGGPEIRSRTYRVFYHHNIDSIKKEIVEWAIEMASMLGCTPCVPAIGIGRTHYEATCLTMDALVEAKFAVQSALEKSITDNINSHDIGPLALGGKTTALATFIRVGPQRASGVRIVSLRMGCCYDPRKATIILE